MAIKGTIKCDWCEKQLIDGDSVFCENCYDALQGRIAELKEGAIVKDSTRKLLEDRIIELEEERNKEKNNERHQI